MEEIMDDIPNQNIQSGQHNQPRSDRSNAVALLLCFFLGLFGAHNFYTGNTQKGVIQLVLTLTGVGLPVVVVWVFIEFIILLVGGYKDGRGLPICW